MTHKTKRLAMVGAIVLMGITGLTGCADKDDVADVNPTYNPVTGDLNVQFAFNVSTGNQAITRMTAANTQATASDGFRGMNGVHLQTLGKDNKPTGQTANGKHVWGTFKAARDYNLDALLSSNEVQGDGTADSENKNTNRRVVEMTLPSGTNTILFYGKAPKTESNDKQGHLSTYKVDTVSANTEFVIGSRLTNTAAFQQSCKMLATIMTRIAQNGLHWEKHGDDYGNNDTRDLRYKFWWMNEKAYDTPTYKNENNEVVELSNPKEENPVSIPGGTANYKYDSSNQTVTTNVGTFKYYEGTIEWYEYGDKYEEDPTKMLPLEEILGQAYHSFTTINDGEIRAGSASAVLQLVSDLWEVTDKVANAEPTSVEEHIAKLLGDRIRTRFGTYFKRNEGKVTFKEVATLKTQLETYVYGITDNTFKDVTKIADFPRNLNLPMGAAQMTFTKNKNNDDGATTRINEFSYVTDLPYDGMTTVTTPEGGEAATKPTTTVEKYIYPAELTYFGNSPVRVSDEIHATADYPQVQSQWDNDDFWVETYGLKGWKSADSGVVQSSTRSVAMEYDVNYGTALLKSTVRYGAGTLKDNNAEIHPGEDDNEINVTSANLFQLTGIVIGGVTNKVGWNFLQKDNDFNYMVYDSDIDQNIPAFNGTTTTGEDGTTTTTTLLTSTTPAYTLVWDNYDAGKGVSNQNEVYVALEFENRTNKGFWGNANYVRNGGTFYIIGKLDPKKFSFPARTQTKYALPPYADADGETIAAGETIKASRVFIQDFMTSADFVIGENSLKHAYVTVPDLRSSEVSLGLSVDIKWETGIEFNNVVLGGDSEE